uniref:4-alpha-glucanotransferase n=2 Tax=Dunaliella tertiolecta TaxID=3047 RepID=A0A7S3QVA9_DUNTE|mmetsp:Transcript_1803/g.4579  ORF Transcript_1803/g.4579 Transcript_1803/m.4579 type:complete len:959 (+) Transcript_1803:59-2935(+)
MSEAQCFQEVVGAMGSKRINLHLRVPFFTSWGQNLVVCGAGAMMGNWDPKRGHPMHCHHEKDVLVWEALLSLPWQAQFSYKYVVVEDGDDDGKKMEKWELDEHVISLPSTLKNGDVVEVLDTWVDRSYPGSILTTSAFTKVLKITRPALKRVVRKPPANPILGEVIVRLRVADYMLGTNESLCVSGSLPHLGAWQVDQMMPLTEVENRWWEGEISVPYTQFPFTFKYAVKTHHPPHIPNGGIGGDSEGVLLEVGEPRMVSLPLSGGLSMGAPSIMVCHDGFFRRDSMWRGAGTAVPVFSLRSQESIGCGEFLDLIKLVDFSERAGLRLVQLLPVNDTGVYNTWWDSYPYSTLSVFALHPQYIALRALRDEMPVGLVEELDAACSALDGKDMDYESTLAFKKEFARKVYDLYGQETLQSNDFKAWFDSQQEWLRPYAAFLILQDLFQTSEHWKWGLLAHPPTQATLERITSSKSDHRRSVEFTYYLQYHLHKQLSMASKYAESKRVVLKGDLPIGVDKRSVDVWCEPHLFRQNKSTGAPPDAFSPTGQNWGFPTYNWEEMSKDNYKWWRRRLQNMSQYFHAYRIDHILGFFRIWEIPGDCVTGLLGHFRPSVPIWKHELDSRGLWDLARLTQPYVRTHILQEVFGPTMWQEVAAKYFLEQGDGVYHFRPQFTTEQSIADIEIRPNSPQWLVEEIEHTKAGLIHCMQNVCLLVDDEDPNRFYPRFAVSSSSSYKELDQDWKQSLSWLHDDYYFRRQDDLWRRSALKKLPVLMDSTDMLVCGEDLGFVPECVPPVMQELGLVGLRIQRMPMDGNVEFNDPLNYHYLTVASPSCHDVQPMRAWYESDPEMRDRFFYNALSGDGPAPVQCSPEVMSAVALQHTRSPSVWTVIPMQDIMALSARYHDRPAAEECINDPTNPKHYWRFRLHTKIEDLIADRDLLKAVQELLILGERANPQELPKL